MVTYPRRS